MNRICVVKNNAVQNIVLIEEGEELVYPLPYDFLIPDLEDQRCIGDTYDPATGTFTSIYDVAQIEEEQ
jgi:hypothetical protein